MPALLNRVADSVLTRIRRMPAYYTRYNNTLPYKINAAYSRFAKECEAAYAAAHPGETFDPSPLSTGAAQLIKGAFPAEKARAYSDRITRMFETNDPALERSTNYDDLQTRITGPLRSLGADLMDVFRSPEVDRAIRSFFRGHYRISWLTAFRTKPAQRVASSWLWHSDSYPPQTCKLFIHLTPVDAQRGATEFMNLEDTMAYRRAGYFGQYLDERYADLQEFGKAHGLPYRPFHFDAEPGDATIFNQNFFHRAVSPRTGFRDVVQFFLLPSMRPWDEQFARDGIDRLTQPSGGYPKDPRPTA